MSKEKWHKGEFLHTKDVKSDAFYTFYAGKAVESLVKDQKICWLDYKQRQFF